MDFYDCPAKPARGAPKCDSTSRKAFIFGVFSIFGIQIGFLSVLCGALSRDSVSKKAKSVTCLCVMVGLILFILRDGSRTFDAEWPADKMPKDGVYANAVIWSVLAGLCYSGWQDSGAVKPNTSALVPSGKFGLPIIVGLVNWLFYALPLTFMADKFVKEGFGREELMAGFTPAVNFLLAAIFQNIGLMCLFNTAIVACSVDKEDAPYRILRGTGAVLQHGRPEGRDHRPPPNSRTRCASSSATNFAILYQTNTWTATPFGSRGDRAARERQAGDPGERARRRRGRRFVVRRVGFIIMRVQPSLADGHHYGGVPARLAAYTSRAPLASPRSSRLLDAAAFALLCSDEPGTLDGCTALRAALGESPSDAARRSAARTA